MTNIKIGITLGSGGGSYKLTETLIAKFAAWFKPTEVRDAYFIDQVGTQEREQLTEGGVAGVVHAGRAIKFDTAKTQYSRTNAVMPANFRLANNSLAYSFDYRIEVAPGGASFILGGQDLADVGNVYAQVESTSGLFSVKITHSTGTLTITSSKVVSDNKWHNYFISVNKLGDVELWIDNQYENSASLSGLTFGDVNKRFC